MNWQTKADTSWKNARTGQWVCAALVSVKGIRVTSDDTMTQLRGAWQMFTFIRQYHPAKARELRKQYGYSRFYELYKEWCKFEFAADVCIDHLESELSNAAMVMQVLDAHDTRDEWMRKSSMIYRSVDKFTTVAYGAPAWFVTWARDTRDLFRQNGVEK